MRSNVIAFKGLFIGEIESMFNFIYEPSDKQMQNPSFESNLAYSITVITTFFENLEDTDVYVQLAKLNKERLSNASI